MWFVLCITFLSAIPWISGVYSMNIFWISAKNLMFICWLSNDNQIYMRDKGDNDNKKDRQFREGPLGRCRKRS